LGTVNTSGGEFVGRDKIDTQINNYNTAPELGSISIGHRGLVVLLNGYFNLSEIESLCFEMGIDDENLRGQTKNEKARSLVKHVADRGRINELKQLMRVQRPNLRAQLS
jgi:5-keto 4-deoxyuronate isomerase